MTYPIVFFLLAALLNSCICVSNPIQFNQPHLIQIHSPTSPYTEAVQMDDLLYPHLYRDDLCDIITDQQWKEILSSEIIVTNINTPSDEPEQTSSCMVQFTDGDGSMTAISILVLKKPQPEKTRKLRVGMLENASEGLFDQVDVIDNLTAIFNPHTYSLHIFTDPGYYMYISCPMAMMMTDNGKSTLRKTMISVGRKLLRPE